MSKTKSEITFTNAEAAEMIWRGYVEARGPVYTGSSFIRKSEHVGVITVAAGDSFTLEVGSMVIHVDPTPTAEEQP